MFARLWKETGISHCLSSLLADRRHQFDVEAAVFLTVVHRLMDPGSDRAADKWKDDHALPGAADLDLHHLYRTMAWLGEELPREEQGHSTGSSPRCVKDRIEEDLFEFRRDLFSDFVLAFFDTTSIYFEGRGGDSLGRHGHSKDHRPDLRQMVVGLVLDAAGRPVCCEMWPGNTTDATTLLPVVDRLRHRFHITRTCVVADRGMISAKTIAALEERGLEYVLGARMRSQHEVSEDVLEDGRRFRVIYGKRKQSKDPSPLKVKEVYVEDRRYIVCHNEEQARKDAADRQAIVAKLRETLIQGDKQLVGNKGFRKYIRPLTAGFEIDEEKIRAEECFDGMWVLRTNTAIATEDVALCYKQLWTVEAMFRSLKSVLDTRPIYHRCDETIRGHVFCSFLALVLMRELEDRMEARGWGEAEWADVLRDIDKLTEATVEAADGKRFAIRTGLSGWCGKVFQAVGVAMPPTVRAMGAGSGA